MKTRIFQTAIGLFTLFIGRLGSRYLSSINDISQARSILHSYHPCHDAIAERCIRVVAPGHLTRFPPMYT